MELSQQSVWSVCMSETLLPDILTQHTTNTSKQKPWPQAKHYKRKKANLSDPIKTFMRAFNTVGTALITENVHVTERHDQHGANRADRLASNLLSGGTLSLCGQPERLRWWGYRPVT